MLFKIVLWLSLRFHPNPSPSLHVLSPKHTWNLWIFSIPSTTSRSRSSAFLAENYCNGLFRSGLPLPTHPPHCRRPNVHSTQLGVGGLSKPFYFQLITLFHLENKAYEKEFAQSTATTSSRISVSTHLHSAFLPVTPDELFLFTSKATRLLSPFLLTYLMTLLQWFPPLASPAALFLLNHPINKYTIQLAFEDVGVVAPTSTQSQSRTSRFDSALQLALRISRFNQPQKKTIFSVTGWESTVAKAKIPFSIQGWLNPPLHESHDLKSQLYLLKKIFM